VRAGGRRAWLRALAALPWAAGGASLATTTAAATAPATAPAASPDWQREADPATDPVRRGRPLAFPRDHGAHPGARTEWWYATGWLLESEAGATPGPAADPATARPLGFQITFFRSRTGLGAGSASRFAPRQLLFAHAALTRPGPDASGGRHRHAQRIARWNGDPAAPGARAALHDADVALPPWTLRRDGPRWRGTVRDDALTLELTLTRTQPLLLQGDAGFSRKGPQEAQASHYYSEPQLAAEVAFTLDGRVRRAQGRGWLDHEWSDELLHPEAVGWDWIGMNLLDGGALTAFVLRRADGRALWAGGSLRPAGGAVRAFAPDEVRFEPGRVWTSPATQARYPVEWTVTTPAGRLQVHALMDAQELDSRGSTGAIYWEGLSELLDAGGRRIGLGYLEMTGYAGALRL
jgi:predicted secreted hydrolase